MKNPTYRYGDLVYHQTATMKVVGSHQKLDRWYYDLYCQADGHIYTTVDKYVVLRERVECASAAPVN